MGGKLNASIQGTDKRRKYKGSVYIAAAFSGKCTINYGV